MTRSAALIIAALLSFAFTPHAVFAAALVLRDTVTVDDNSVSLGDLFDGAAEKADVVVAPAPKIGRQAVYDATWLANVARINGLDWQPTSQTDHVTVERNGHVVPGTEIEGALKTEASGRFAGQGAAKKVQVSLDNRNVPLYSDPDARSDIQVRDFWMDKAGGRFSATIAASDDAGAQVVKVSGRLFEVTSVPVLTRRLGASEVVAPGDIRFVEMRSDVINRDVITDPDALIGMVPRRQVTENVPLRASDFRAPVVVAKGSLVTMVMQTPYLLLTSQGRAVEDGALGQAIRVMNTQSKTTVDAVVDGPSRVLVRTGAAQATAEMNAR
jgi:flagella basal body P-ring formation protein FlgA